PCHVIAAAFGSSQRCVVVARVYAASLSASLAASTGGRPETIAKSVTMTARASSGVSSAGSSCRASNASIWALASRPIAAPRIERNRSVVSTVYPVGFGWGALGRYTTGYTTAPLLGRLGKH